MMLTYLTNCLYKNGKIKESLLIAKKLNNAMHEFEGFLKNQFLFYYYNALVINYSNIDKEKALNVLKEAEKIEVIQTLPTFGLFIYLNTGLILYDQKKYKESIKNISRLILQQDFINLSTHLQLKIIIAELIIRHHLNQTDIIHKKIKQTKRKYKKELNNNKRDLMILLILEQLIYCTNIYLDKKIQKDIKEIQSISLKTNAEDTDIINYNNWLNTLYQN